jgi:hypothetical protein
MKRPTVESYLENRIKQLKKGSILFAEDFQDSGMSQSVNRALSRLNGKKIIIRLAQGIYFLPRQDKYLGIVYPAVEDVAKAIAHRDHARIVPTGVYALNKLGLSTQVPLNTVFLTDGAARIVRLGRQSIKFKKSTPKNLAAKGEISSLVIQALREIGKENVNDEHLSVIINHLLNERQEYIKHDAGIAPAWIRNILLQTIKISEKQ